MSAGDEPQYPLLCRQPAPAEPAGVITSPSDVNKFISLDPEQLGEAFEKPDADFRALLPKGGCRGIRVSRAGSKSAVQDQHNDVQSSSAAERISQVHG